MSHHIGINLQSFNDEINPIFGTVVCCLDSIGTIGRITQLTECFCISVSCFISNNYNTCSPVTVELRSTSVTSSTATSVSSTRKPSTETRLLPPPPPEPPPPGLPSTVTRCTVVVTIIIGTSPPPPPPKNHCLRRLFQIKFLGLYHDHQYKHIYVL